MRPDDRDDRQAGFPSTRWSRIMAAGGARDLDALARAYWRPIQAYLATRLRCAEDDASDLAQEAFAWLLRTGLFDKADPARGRFRGFLKKALANFAIEQHRAANAQKRGGGASHVSLDAEVEPVDPHGKTPDQVLDETWRAELLVRAQEQLRQELEQNQRATYYRLFAEYFLGEGDAPDQQTLAARHGITRTDVSNWLDYGKRRYRAILRELVTETVTTDEDLQDELRWLFGRGESGTSRP